MAHGYTLSASSVVPDTARNRRPRPAPYQSLDHPWRFSSGHPSRLMLTTAMLISAGLHLGLLFGIRRSAPPPAKKADTEMIALMLLPPQLKELEEELDSTPREDSPPLDLALPVPMQADLPAIARPEDFVQAFDFSSLLEKPDLSQTKISVIPEHIRRGVDLREKIGAIFNIADLDRSPEPIVQPAPVFPFNLKRESIEGRVRVEFVVDTEGRVHHPFVIESTHPGFEEAAMIGVARWKFRPGMKNGRKVNTRMQVPIVFKILDDGF